MKKFAEYVAERDLLEAEQIDKKIADVANLVAKKNPKIVPGLTAIKDIKQAMQDTNVKKMVQTDPKAAGAIGAYLGGPDAAKELQGA